eukprot:s1899_g2.t1
MRAALLLLALASASRWPSVSVQMVTYKRPKLLLEALNQVALQNYKGDIEVVIIDDSPESMEEEIEPLRGRGSIKDVRYIYLPERMSIGAKRNLATRSTEAEVLVIWDDDDVFTRDRIRKQVLHLLRSEDVNCSGIEVSSFYSVPTKELTVRPAGLEPLVFENTLCFPRSWWEGNGYGFGEAWEVSGQGEGTLEPWWTQVQPLLGKEEPFLYIYLPSSASGGSAVNKDRRPPPQPALATLVAALQSGRFPDEVTSPHISGVLNGARDELEELLDCDGLMQITRVAATEPFETPVRRYPPAAPDVVAEAYPERIDPQLRAEPSVAAHVWRRLSSCDLSSAGWLLSSSPPCRLKEDFISEDEASSLLLGLRPDALAGMARRERGGVESRAEQKLRQRVAAAVGVEERLLEPTRFVRYSREGQAFEPHVDWIVDSADPQLAQLGQRVATALIFLTDLPEGVGGETDFPALGFAVTPKKGTVLLWPNVGADGTPLPEMIHEAMPMLQDGIEKIALNVWIRDRPLPRDMTILENLLQS